MGAPRKARYILREKFKPKDLSTAPVWLGITQDHEVICDTGAYSGVYSTRSEWQLLSFAMQKYLEKRAEMCNCGKYHSIEAIEENIVYPYPRNMQSEIERDWRANGLVPSEEEQD